MKNGTGQLNMIEPTVEISPSGLMDLHNAAVYLGVSEATIRNLWRFRKITAKKVGRELRFHRDELDNFCREG